jgi:hypothetical protein
MKDEAWAEMMGEDQAEPQAGLPYAVALYLHNASAKAGDAVQPHYLVAVNGHAVGEVHFAAQNMPEAMRPSFLHQASYEVAFNRSVAKVGFKKTMERVNGVMYRAKIDKTALAARIEAKVQADADAKYRRKAAELRDSFINLMATAAMALTKNIHFESQGHPLKEAMVKGMAALNIHPAKAVPVIEAAFQEGFLPTFVKIAEKATEWQQAPKEFVAAIEKDVRTSAPKTASAPDASQPYSRLDHLVAGSLPIVMAGKVPEPDDMAGRFKSIIAGALGSV